MDYIYVYNENDEKKKMEVVSIFDLTDNEYKYIIYKPLDKLEYFIGKYKGNKIVDLETDLSDLEMELANAVLKKVLGDNNA